MQLTQKGQVTVPKRVRDHLEIGPGSEVEFMLDEKGVRLVKINADVADETPGEELVRLLKEAGRRYGLTDRSADDVMEMTRGPFDDVDPR